MARYSVRVIYDEIEVEADSVEEAEQIAEDIATGDVRTQLDYGFSIIAFETEVLDEEE